MPRELQQPLQPGMHQGISPSNPDFGTSTPSMPGMQGMPSIPPLPGLPPLPNIPEMHGMSFTASTGAGPLSAPPGMSQPVMPRELQQQGMHQGKMDGKGKQPFHQ